MCDLTSCGQQLDAPIELDDLAGVRLGDRPELWIAKGAKSDLRKLRRLAVAVYRIEAAALVPDRLYIAGGSPNALPVVRLEGGFLHLHER